MTGTWRCAVVVGASSGIGEAMVRRLARSGTRVALVARRERQLRQIAAEINAESAEERALVWSHDVRDVAAVPGLFQEIATRLGALDLVVYAAGVLPRIGRQEFPTETDVGTIETNFTGAVAWLNEAASRFMRRGAGTIVGISSVAGDRGRVGNPVYNASKAALDSYLESLRNRLARKGVTVLTAKPGYVRTAMLEGASIPPFFPVSSADEAAREILEAAAAGRRVVYVPDWLRWVMLVVKAVPAPVFERLNV